MQASLRIFISGKVQGVYYRATAAKKAKSLGLKGWVKNIPDGRVELLAEGDLDTLAELEAWCWTGSKLANVEQVLAERIPHQGYRDFVVDRS
jgi:acylphosphatase